MPLSIMLADILVVACADAFRDSRCVVASGVGAIPRLGLSLARLTHSPRLVAAEGEALLVGAPSPIGPRRNVEPGGGHNGVLSPFFSSSFWAGRRHAMMTAAHIDRLGRPYLACNGPLCSSCTRNIVRHEYSLFAPTHSRRFFVEGGEAARLERQLGAPAPVRLRRIVTNLCVMECGGPGKAVRIRSLHPGVRFDDVQSHTGFPLERVPAAQTTAPTREEAALIARLDPHGLRLLVQ